LSNERKIEMEQRYQTALEIILAMCERDKYLNGDDVKLVCETALKERGNEDESA
jgi:hypothetical protein